MESERKANLMQHSFASNAKSIAFRLTSCEEISKKLLKMRKQVWKEREDWYDTDILKKFVNLLSQDSSLLHTTVMIILRPYSLILFGGQDYVDFHE